jgi:hypothetical protein
MNSEGNDRLDFYLDCLRKGAENKIMVNFHGANKPAGEPRTWPNEMTREGIKALEHNKWGRLTFPHYTTLPFTRMLAGHGDFTPTTFQKNMQRGSSSALQLATAVVFTSPLLCWADKPEVYLESSALKYILTMPTSWDETRVLEGSEIGGIAAFARRDGDEWYVAIMNGESNIAVYDLQLDFLEGGRYLGELVEDDMSDSGKMVHSTGTYSADMKVRVAMLSGGGFVMRLSKLSAEPSGGGFYPGQSVEITAIDPDSEIRYTLDGSEPTARSRKVSGPVKLKETCDLRAKIMSGDGKGMQIRRSYRKTPLPEPRISASPEDRDGRAFVVSMSSAAGEVHYTLDGSEPDRDSPVYRAAFKLDKDAVVRAVTLMNDERSPEKKLHVRTALPEPRMPDVYLDPADFLKNEAGWGEPRVNKSVTGRALIVNGRTYERGIGTHANGEIVLKCKPEYKRFVAVAGIDGAQQNSPVASMVFKLVADGKVLEESPLLRKGALQHWNFDVEIPRGTQQLRLIVGDAGDDNKYDHANWCNAGFLL